MKMTSGTRSEFQVVDYLNSPRTLALVHIQLQSKDQKANNYSRLAFLTGVLSFGSSHPISLAYRRQAHDRLYGSRQIRLETE